VLRVVSAACGCRCACRRVWNACGYPPLSLVLRVFVAFMYLVIVIQMGFIQSFIQMRKFGSLSIGEGIGGLVPKQPKQSKRERQRERERERERPSSAVLSRARASARVLVKPKC